MRRNSRENIVRSNSRPSSRPSSGNSSQQTNNQQNTFNQSSTQREDNSTDISQKSFEQLNLNEQQLVQEFQQELQQQEAYPVFQDPKLVLNWKHEFTNSDLDHRKILSIKYSNSGDQVAVSLQSGEIQILDEQKGQVQLELKDNLVSSPCTGIKWVGQENSLQTQNLLLGSYSNGTILVWHSTARKFIHRYEEFENPINCIDINKSGTKFVTGGNDENVKIYDLGKKSLPQILEGTAGIAPKHSNRVYCVKYNPENENQLFSSGWDSLIVIWDARHHSSSNYIYGPKIFGEALDVQGNKILTGSWREERQLQLWDMRKTQVPYQNIPWIDYEKNKSFVYCCAFQKNKNNQILAGASGTNQIRLFDLNLEKNQNCSDIVQLQDQGSVYGLDFSNKKFQVTVGTANGFLNNFTLK